jgi:hypothetical protein
MKGTLKGPGGQRRGTRIEGADLRMLPVYGSGQGRLPTASIIYPWDNSAPDLPIA